MLIPPAFTNSSTFVIVCYALVIVGYPMQIYRMYKVKTSASTSVFLMASVFLGHLSLGSLAFLQENWVLMYPQVPGTFFTGVIVWLCIYYRYIYRRPAVS